MVVLAMLIMLVGQASAGGSANAIAAKESGLRKALTNHLKKAARDEGLKNIDGSSLVTYSTPYQFGVAAKVQDGNGVIAIAYFDTTNPRGLKGLFTIEIVSNEVVVLREVSGNKMFELGVERDESDISEEPVIAIDNSTDRRLWCFPGDDGTVKYCTDLDAPLDPPQ